MSWSDPSRWVEELFVEESVAGLPWTEEIVARAGLPVTVVPERGRPNTLDNDCVGNLSAGKRQLFLSRNRGRFFKPCPGTREYQCCDYQVLGCGAGCPIDCAYCILQAYLNVPWILHYMNIDRMFAELRAGLGENPQMFFRVGTGEFTDSLALDRITALSRRLVPFFSEYDNAVLELKTKSAMIDNLLDLDHGGRTVVAWSVNSPQVMAAEEVRAASLDDRLTAAARCAEQGYHLAFHFDPVVEYDGWEEGYAETVRRLYAKVPAEAIAWISVGALRYIPRLKEIGIQRFPRTRIYYNEFVAGLDGKSRYFRPKRVRLYHHICSLLREKAAPRTCIYFCMESDEIWREVMGFAPGERGGLPKMLDISVQG